MSSASITPEVSTEKPLFRELDPDDPDPEATVIDSACMSCFRSGLTRLLLTKIPFFKEVVLMSFKCEHCGFENNEIQSASEIQPKGIHIELNVKNQADINRRVVRSDFTSINIPEVELEIPVKSQKGEITTVEGIIDRTIRGLSQDQEKRRQEHPDAAVAIDAYIVRLTELKEVKSEFNVILEDISGNSFIENPKAPANDPYLKINHFVRTKEQDHTLGLYTEAEIAETKKPQKGNENHLLKPIEEDAWPIEELHGEVLRFPTSCHNCHKECETNMKVTNIPHFKEVVIMATVCEHCGHKTNEVKSGGGIEERGMRFEVRVENKEDLTRDVLKSETCSLSIPELQCEVGPSALNGRFTTTEGILTAMKDQLQGDSIVFHDSDDESSQKRWQEFLEKFNKVLSNELTVTLILDDPAGNSYVQSLSDDDTPDPKLKIEKYVRSHEQNEELGLNDMKTEDYQS